MGTTFQFDNQVSGPATLTVTFSGEVLQLTSFEGQTGVSEVRLRVSDSQQPEVIEQLDYLRYDGLSVITYGSINVITLDGVTVESRTVYNPPEVDTSAALAVGASVNIASSYSVTTTRPGLPPTVISFAETRTSTYLGQEVITVPAGTFTACRFRTVESDAPNDVQFQWLAVGSGAPVRGLFSTPGEPDTVFELLPSSRLNGAPL